MSLKNSRYVRKETAKNQWSELPLSEDVLIDAATYALRLRGLMIDDDTIERVIVGEPAKGIYPLSVAILKRKEEK